MNNDVVLTRTWYKLADGKLLYYPVERLWLQFKEARRVIAAWRRWKAISKIVKLARNLFAIGCKHVDCKKVSWVPADVIEQVERARSWVR
jgi:hypothetical protein